MSTAEDWFKQGLAALDRSRGADRDWEYDSDLREAVDAFDHAIALDPNHLGAQRERGLLLARLEQHEAALDSLVVAANLGGADADLHLAAAKSLLALKLFDRALGAFDEVLGLRPNDDVALVGRAESLTALQRDELALAAWDEAIRLLVARKVEHHGKMIRDLTDDWRAQKAREARSKIVARRSGIPSP